MEVPAVFPTECVLNAPVPQVGEELLEVPNVVSQSVEQTVDIPVHGGVKRARIGFQGSVPGQSSTASCRGSSRFFSRTGFNSASSSRCRRKQSSAARGGDGLQNFDRGQSSRSSRRSPGTECARLALSVHVLHPDADREEIMQLFLASEQDV